MKRPIVAVGVVLVAAAMFAVGALRPLDISSEPSIASEAIDAGSVLAPAGGGRSLDASIAALQDKLKTGTRDAGSFASLGLAYLQKARITADPSYYPKAQGVLQRSLDLQPADNLNAFIGMGALAAGRHDFAVALRWGRKAVAAAPYNSPARGIVADSLIELGRYDAAARTLQKMVDLRPDLASFSRISYLRELRGDVPGAVAAMERAAQWAGGLGEDLAWAYFQLGELHLSVGDVGSAQAAFERATQVAPDYYLPKVGLARLAAARDDFDRAAAIYSEIVARYPAPQYVIALGDVLKRSGDDEGARRNYDLVRVEQRLAEASGVIPDVELTLFYADHGLELAETLRRARRQYSARPSIRVADGLAWILYAKGDYAEARRFSKEALRLGTRDALYLFHAGMIEAKLGNETSARRYLSRALSLNPAFSILHAPIARRTLRSLR